MNKTSTIFLFMFVVNNRKAALISFLSHKKCFLLELLSLDDLNFISLSLGFSGGLSLYYSSADSPVFLFFFPFRSVLCFPPLTLMLDCKR